MLALAPSESLVWPGFLRRILKFSIPAGLVAAGGTLLAYEFARQGDGGNIPLGEQRTVAVMVALVGFASDYFEIFLPPLWLWGSTLAIVLMGGALITFWALLTLPVVEPVDERHTKWCRQDSLKRSKKNSPK